MDRGGGVMGGKLVSIVTLVRIPDVEGPGVEVGPAVTTSEVVSLEKEFLSVKLGTTELFNASALVSVLPGSVEELLKARFEEVGIGGGVEVEVEVDVVT